MADSADHDKALERLDDAIHEFIRAQDPDATPAGWALVFQTNYLDPEPGEGMQPLQWDAGYALQNGMSPFATMGLLDHVRDELSTVFQTVHSGVWNDDGDDDTDAV